MNAVSLFFSSLLFSQWFSMPGHWHSQWRTSVFWHGFRRSPGFPTMPRTAVEGQPLPPRAWWECAQISSSCASRPDHKLAPFGRLWSYGHAQSKYLSSLNQVGYFRMVASHSTYWYVSTVYTVDWIYCCRCEYKIVLHCWLFIGLTMWSLTSLDWVINGTTWNPEVVGMFLERKKKCIYIYIPAILWAPSCFSWFSLHHCTIWPNTDVLQSLHNPGPLIINSLTVCGSTVQVKLHTSVLACPREH